MADQKAETPAKRNPRDAKRVTSDTRERILDIALALFVEQGYEKTSLREIAEQLGFSKAAIYYHFESKQEILLALHYRLHDLGREVLDTIDPKRMQLTDWFPVLDFFIDQLLDNRVLFAMHERNRTALEQIHNEEHEEDHNDLESFIREALGNEEIPLRDRVRVSCAIGAVMIGLLINGDAFATVSSDELKVYLRETVRDIFASAETISDR